ncbi:hypothetical protein OEZ82_27345, partial [Leclercia adecarboxylata]|uniref:hypothetical protein n=1 Tax=Leclercia adecarboxylata TaxID=83655 RepID=UPI00234D1B1C
DVGLRNHGLTRRRRILAVVIGPVRIGHGLPSRKLASVQILGIACRDIVLWAAKIKRNLPA